MDFSGVRSTYPNSDEEIILEDYPTSPSNEVQEQAARVAKIAKRQKNWKKCGQVAGIFATGVIMGDMGSALMSEITSNIYNFSIPIIMREISLYYALTTLGVYGFVMIPAALYGMGALDCIFNKSEETKQTT